MAYNKNDHKDNIGINSKKKNSDKSNKSNNNDHKHKHKGIIYLWNISKLTTEKELLSHFEILGDIEELKYFTKKSSINEG